MFKRILLISVLFVFPGCSLYENKRPANVAAITYAIRAKQIAVQKGKNQDNSAVNTWLTGLITASKSKAAFPVGKVDLSISAINESGVRSAVKNALGEDVPIEVVDSLDAVIQSPLVTLNKMAVTKSNSGNSEDLVLKISAAVFDKAVELNQRIRMKQAEWIESELTKAKWGTP